MEKIQSNTTSLTIHPLIQALWSTHLKIYRQSQTIATIAIMHHLTRDIWIDTWNHIILKNPINVLKTTQNPIWQTICLMQTNATSVNFHFRTHLKTHYVKSKKCNHCDYASSRTGHLKRHLKTHNTCNQRNPTSYQANNLFESNKCSQCEHSSYNSGYLRTHLKTHYSKSNKCNHCDYASSHTSHLKRHMKSHDSENQINLTKTTKHPIWQSISLSQTSATSVNIHLTLHAIHMKSHNGEISNKCNEGNPTSSLTHNLLSPKASWGLVTDATVDVCVKYPGVKFSRMDAK